MVNTKLSKREKEIVNRLTHDAAISVADLSKALGVSAVTIRSDLNSLAQKGIIMRTRGGAAPAFHPHVIVRQGLMMSQKSRIAQAAAALIDDGDTVMIEAGTTLSLIPRYLLGKRDVRIVTNSTLILPFARTNPGIHLTIVGGQFRRATESLVGPIALAELDRFHVRLAFVGTDGFSLQSGLTTHLVEGAEIVRKMAQCSRRRVLLADSSKYGQQGFVKVLPVEALDVLISDTGLGAGAREELEQAGIELMLV